MSNPFNHMQVVLSQQVLSLSKNTDGLLLVYITSGAGENIRGVVHGVMDDIFGRICKDSWSKMGFALHRMPQQPAKHTLQKIIRKTIIRVLDDGRVVENAWYSGTCFQKHLLDFWIFQLLKNVMMVMVQSLLSFFFLFM